MAMEIFKLVGSIFVDSTAAEESISKTDKKASNVGQTLLKGVGTAAKWGAGLAAGAGVAVTALTKVASDSATAMDVIDKGSAKVGISKQAYQEWGYVLSQNGMDIGKLETGMKSLVSAMDGAAAGTQSQIDKFTALGVSIYDTNGKLKSQEQMMNESLYALANMENGTEKARLATELFGRAGVEMMPMLNQGAESMSELTQRAHDLGLVVSDEAVDAGVKLGDTMDDVKQSIGMLGTNIGAALMPAVQSFVDLIIANLPTIHSMVSQLGPILVGLMQSLLPSVMSLAESILPLVFSLISALMPPLQTILETVLPVIINLLNTLLPPLIEVVQQLLPPLLNLLIPILDLLGPIIELFTPILDLVVAILTPLSHLITNLLTPLISVISKVIQIALIPLQARFTALSGVLSGTFNAAVSLVLNAVSTIKGVFSGLIQFIKGVFTGNWKAAWNGIKGIFSSIWQGISGAFRAPMNWIIDGINAFIRGLNRLKIPDWVPGVGGLGFSIGTLPRLAAGGILEKGQTGFLEGTGAEAVVPLENNKKWISAVARDMQSEGIGGDDRTLAILAAILDLVEQLVGSGIYLDGNKLVGALAGPLDKKLGQIAAQKARA